MAIRRMFAKSITDSDDFLDLPLDVQLLYFHLGMQADDEGFLNSTRKIVRMLGVEPVLAALLGVGLGVLVAFLLLGRQALGTSCLISLGLYLAGCLLGTILGTVRAVNRKPLELLQVKE